MTHYLKLFAFGCILFLTYATSSFAQSFPDTAWMKLYGGSAYDGGTDIHQTFDGGYIVLARAESDDGDLSTAPAGIKQWILRLDASGNIEWERHYVISAQSSSIIQTRDSGYVFGMPFVTKLKNDGSLDWQANFMADDVIQTYEGGYAALAGTTIIKFDSLANIEWEFPAMINGVLGNVGAYDLRQTPDSGIVFCGDWYEDWWTKGWWLVKTDKDGNETLNINSSGTQYRCLEVAKDGNLLLSSMSGNYLKTGPPQLWSENIDSISLRDIMENIDSTIVMCGSDHVILSDTLVDAYIIKTEPDGDSITTVMVGGNRADFLNRINPTEDNGYIAVGATRSYEGNFGSNHGNSDLWIVRYKQDTSIHTPTNVENNQVKSEVNIYPTLTKGVVNVLVPEGYGRVTLSVFNSLGQEVYRREGKGLQSIDLSGNNTGMYILQVHSATEWKSFKIMLSN